MRSYLLLLISILSLNLKIHGQVQKSSTPNWVQITEYNRTPKIDETSIEQGLLSLLYDHQINEQKKEFYYRFATKITENVGVQSGSSISIFYDPSYQTLQLNSIQIIRDGNTIDKLKASEFQVIRRELNAESYIYDGSLSAITNLTDVRIGDIIDYSYTIKGDNPIYKNNFSSTFYLNNTQPLGKLYIAIISKKDLDFKYINTDITFQKKNKQNSYYYTIDREDIESFEYDLNMPSWEFQYEMAMVSDYKNWKNIVNWGVEVFDINRTLSKKLSAKITEINTKNKTSGAKINATLNFVQDKIRYLGLESGIGAYKPFNSNKVIEQRFGDCKDKSLLMVTMLQKMGIEAYPMLVNTYMKETVTKVLPSPNMFDHCVVKVIDEKAGVLWFDPTISDQGGEFDTTTFPDYRVGLVLKKGNSEFDKVYSLANNNLEITDFYELEEVGKGAILKTTAVYFDDQADYMRTYFKNNSINSIKKEFENFYATYFYDIKSLKSPRFEDDLKNNKFTTFEEYKIDSIWQPAFDEGQITTSFYPYSVINSLNMPNKRERELPFSVSYPLTRTHTINVKLPEKWNIEKDSYFVNSSTLFYDFDVRYANKKDILSITHILKMKKDYVSTEEFTAYYDDLKKIDTNIVYSLLIPKNGISSSNDDVTLEYFGILILILLSVFATWSAMKVYAYNPEAKIESYFEKNKKINGWLILVGIGLCITPFRILFDILNDEFILLNGRWLQILNPTSSFYNLPLGIVVFFELVVNVFVFAFIILFIVLFLKKRSSFPKLYAFTLIGMLVFNLIDSYLVGIFTNTSVPFLENTAILAAIIKTGIVTSYLLISDSVKETFVQKLN